MTCDFQQCGILTSVDSDEPVQPPFKLETPNDVQSGAQHSDQTVCMSQLIYRVQKVWIQITPDILLKIV